MLRFFLFSWMLAGITNACAEVAFNEQDMAFIRSLGPWPVEATPDTSNRFSQQEQAIELGRQLFFDRRLSADSFISCADCHQPNQAFQDGIALNKGLNVLHRNTSSLINIGHRPWYGWGGEHDSLWSQSIRPMLAATEMHTDISKLKATLEQDAYFQCAFQQATQQTLQSLSEEDFLITLGKLLASYQETIRSEKSPFDRYRDQLLKQEKSTPALSISAQKGLKLFVGEGRCVFCHSGPNLTNGEFGDIGVPFFINNGQSVDKGRYQGIQSLRKDPYNLLGKYNDDPSKSNALRTQHLQTLHRNWGEFKVPSLRNVAQTAPYMHNGSIATLAEVIDFYSELNEERLHADGEKILRPLHWSQEEKINMVDFLTSLTGKVTSAKENKTIFQQCFLN
ncbi:cytochrome c peroxidase [Marinomonas sp. 5E14-1]|uniref:cytochrome-c peroxidase n=1 Tax=Marinomonas sp. 5E14-1 TaxID=3153922 RepID=UPI0032659391